MDRDVKSRDKICLNMSAAEILFREFDPFLEVQWLRHAHCSSECQAGRAPRKAFMTHRSTKVDPELA